MKLDWPFPGNGATEEEPTEFSFEYAGNRYSETIQRPITSKVQIAIIDDRMLFRDCLARCLKSANDCEIATFSSVRDYVGASMSSAIVIVAMPRSSGADGGADADAAAGAIGDVLEIADELLVDQRRRPVERIEICGLSHWSIR